MKVACVSTDRRHAQPDRRPTVGQTRQADKETQREREQERVGQWKGDGVSAHLIKFALRRLSEMLKLRRRLARKMVVLDGGVSISLPRPHGLSKTILTYTSACCAGSCYLSPLFHLPAAFCSLPVVLSALQQFNLIFLVVDI